MAFLKKIKFGTGEPTSIAKTIVKGAPEGVISVSNTSGYNNNDTEEKDYSYDIDVNVDNATIVKSSGSLAVGTVPAEKVSVADSDDLFTGTNVETVLAELDGKITSTGNAAKKYKVVAVDSPASTSLAEYKLQVAEGTSKTYADVSSSATIVVPKDNAFVTAQLGHVGATADSSTGVITDGSGADALLIEYINGSGVYTLVAVPIGSFLTESEFKDGLAVNANGEVSAKLGQGLEFGGESGENQSIKVKIDSTSEGDSQTTSVPFLSVGANGVKISGIKDEIDRKIAALDYTNTAVAGQYVSEVDETNGVISVSRANVADAVLTGYTKGNAPAAGSEAVAATDDVKGAIAKLEHQVDAAKSAASAAHSVVAQGSDNTHVTVTASQPDASGAITYTIGESNIASATDLTAEVNRAKSAETAIDGAVGLTKDTNGESRTYTNTGEYIGKAATNTVASDIKALDTQLKTVSDKADAIQYEVSGTTLVFYGISEKTNA